MKTTWAALSRRSGSKTAPEISKRRGLDAHCKALVHLYSSESAQVVALRGVDLDIDPGEMLALLGPSGTGKSTLLKLLGGLIQPTAGRILVGGRDLRGLSPSELRLLRATDIGMVLQDAGTNLLPYATGEQNVWFAQIGARRAGHRVQEPGEVLGQLDLGSLAAEQVSRLSGGDQQLVALAVGVAASPSLLLVDEPTSQLDTAGREAAIALLHAINKRIGSTIVTVTHDPAVAAGMPRTVTIRDGRVGTEGRHGEEFAVVGSDGSVQLPPDVLEVMPPNALVRIRRHADGVDLRLVERGGDNEPLGSTGP
ncbi:MAG: ATP-binding cassette domain-containing protein [Acidimicrobiales bacterium]|jgi:ABC-type lipoprotein export system ATPase subunit